MVYALVETCPDVKSVVYEALPYPWLGRVSIDKFILNLSHKDIDIFPGHFGAHTGTCSFGDTVCLEDEVVLSEYKFHKLNEGFVTRFDVIIRSKPVKCLFAISCILYVPYHVLNDTFHTMIHTNK